MRIPPLDRTGIKPTAQQDRVEHDVVAHPVAHAPQQHELVAAEYSAETRPRPHWWQRLFR
jgi:hypothetical protein